MLLAVDQELGESPALWTTKNSPTHPLCAGSAVQAVSVCVHPPSMRAAFAHYARSRAGYLRDIRRFESRFNPPTAFRLMP